MTIHPYRIVLHGGAGPTPGRDYSQVEVHLRDLAERCASWLANGDAAIDVVERAVCNLEDSGLYVAGRGSCPNSAGDYELDASIMDGARHRAGGVCAVRSVVNPVSAARLVMDRTDHVLLAGDGAEAFAREQDLAFVDDPSNYYVLPVGVDAAELTAGSSAHGTVGAVALDISGRLAAATSTGGTFGKRAGRVGDTPLPGLGTWADDRVAVSCTGIGEAFILAGGAGDVAARMRYGGMRLDHAAAAMLAQVAKRGGDGGLIAIDRDGEIAMSFNTPGMKRAVAGDGIDARVVVF